VVNVWGILPNSDPFWRGNLRELGRLLEGIGLTPNLLLGDHQGVEAWKLVPHAALNLVVSPWGEAPARLLEQRYGTPLLLSGGLPVGPASGKLMRLVVDKLGLNPQQAEDFIGREEAALDRRLAGLADSYYRHGFQREFALVGESAQVEGIATYLGQSLGLLPRTLVVTDNPPESLRGELEVRLAGILAGCSTDVLFSEDQAEIADAVRAGGAGLILGSVLEQAIADETGVPFLAVSLPVSNRIILDRAYAGYRGAATLLEDLGSAILASYSSRRV
jgi:nitrogenase molybdenum-iron protein beta chain